MVEEKMADKRWPIRDGGGKDGGGKDRGGKDRGGTIFSRMFHFYAHLGS